MPDRCDEREERAMSGKKKKRGDRTKRKVIFALCCILYLISFIVFGIIIGNPMTALIPMCIFSVIAVWQLKLDEGKNNKYILIMLGVNLFLSCISMGIRAFLLGDPYAVTTMITAIVSLLVIVGLPILIVFGIAKKNNVGPNDPLIQPKNYTQEELEIQKRKSYAVAKRSVFMSNLSHISLNQLMLSLVLFLAVYMGISAISYTSGKHMPAFMMSGGIYLYICGLSLLAFTVSGMWSAIGYKRLEIMCIHMGVQLQGAYEVNESAMRANFANQMGKAAGIPAAHGIGILGSVKNVIQYYLYQNEQKIISDKSYKILSRVFMIAQIGVAVFLAAKMYFL